MKNRAEARTATSISNIKKYRIIVMSMILAYPAGVRSPSDDRLPASKLIQMSPWGSKLLTNWLVTSRPSLPNVRSFPGALELKIVVVRSAGVPAETSHAIASGVSAETSAAVGMPGEPVLRETWLANGEPSTGESVPGQAYGWRFTLRAAAVAWAAPPGS